MSEDRVVILFPSFVDIAQPAMLENNAIRLDHQEIIQQGDVLVNAEVPLKMFKLLRLRPLGQRWERHDSLAACGAEGAAAAAADASPAGDLVRVRHPGGRRCHVSKRIGIATGGHRRERGRQHLCPELSGFIVV